ncbi:unnamed protein product [Tetraodon nigroviridis]|uniref:(spotted green pufferfish) hypothetical protein n=1 Tax=Tetraodon nigroviridis TaxID=99883 RepID=Q4SEN4_TETNG|nr:unnamed protein product [Tetraodon nigroviridis]
MAAFHALLPLLLHCCAPAASAHPAGHPSPSCQVVQTDAFCGDLNLRAAPPNLPRHIHMLDLSHNQVQNLSQETLAYRTGFRHLNLQANQIHFIQPGLFRDMADLKVLDLSRNHLSAFALSKTNLGPLTSVESLDLSSNGLFTGMSDYFLSESPSLESVSLSSNSITRVAENTFSGSSALTRISLHNNVILEIEDGAFDSLAHLTELDLSKNSIACIADFNLCNLKVLNLSKNSLELFQSARSAELYKLLSLDLSENKMSHFPLLPQTNILEHLDVSRNRIQSVNVTDGPETRSKAILTHLKFLDLSFNQLRSLPESFFYCMLSLKVLKVSNNCISSFSVSAESVLSTVEFMDLSYNSLQSLTFGRNTLRSLEELLLQGNHLATVDHQIFQGLPNLKHLQLQQNNLEICAWGPSHQEPTDCVSFTSISSLKFLNLSENSLQTLPANAFAATPLSSLDLSQNLGLDMDERSLAGLENSLVHLQLRENNISRLKADLSSLRSLKHIDLSTNQLTSLPAWNQESSIESLNLQNNNLVTLDYSTMLTLERSLKTLYMGSNPLSCCQNLPFLHMVQHSAVVVPDIETVTCVHEEHSAPVNIEKVTREMCHQAGVHNYVIVLVITLIKPQERSWRKPRRRTLRTSQRRTEAPDKVPEKTNNASSRRVCVLETCEHTGTNTAAVVFGWAPVQTV